MAGRRKVNKVKKPVDNKIVGFPKWARLIQLDEVGENGETIKLEFLELSTTHVGQNSAASGKSNKGRKQLGTGQRSCKTATKNKAEEKNAPGPSPKDDEGPTMMVFCDCQSNPEEFTFISNENADGGNAIMEVDLTSPTVVYPVQVTPLKGIWVRTKKTTN